LAVDSLQKEQGIKMSSKGIQPLWVLVAGYWLWMIWACSGEWSNNQDYNYGWFVPPLALYFWWKRHERPQAAVTSDEWQVTGSRGSQRCWLAWGVVLFSLLLIFPIELVRQTPIHWRPVLWSIGLIAFVNTLAVAWLTGGRTSLGKLLFPAAFMLLGIPWPTFVENAISFPLMQLVTQWSVGLIHLLGYPATAAGTTITLPNCTVGVEEACSGLRSLQTALMLGAAAGELARLRTGARLALLLVAFVLALAGNQVRVLMLVMAGISGGNAAVSQVHDAAGYVVLAILLVGVGLAAWAMGKVGGGDEWKVGSRQWSVGSKKAEKGGRNSEAGKGERFETGDLRKGRGGGWVVLGVAGLAMVLAHGWFWWRGSMAPAPKAAMLAPAESGDFQADDNVPPEILGVLGPDEYRYIRELRDGVLGKVAGYHFYWRPRKGNANQLYHRPDRCMPGAGWRIEGEVERQSVRLGDREFVFNVFPFRGPGGPALMLWGSFLNGEPVEIEFNSDVYLNTANLAQFIRTGTRTYSYEVAALIMPYEGARPTPAQIEAFANRVFTATEN
jgi:exosortase